ncbi:MAG: ABC transporter ATP-binding protein [Oligoflexia bacterium]|nr:ABC transporter ATP-binding protein [Oligoflexia bacterium]
MKKLFAYLLPYIKPYWKWAILSLFLSFPLSAIKGIQAWLVKYVVEILTPHSSFKDALILSLALLGLALLNYPCRFFHFYLMRYVVDRAACLMRSDIYSKLQRLPLSFFVVKKSGTLVSNIINDTRTLSEGVKGSIDLFREPLTALVMFGTALYSDWQLTLVIIVVAPLFVMIFVKSGRLVRHNQEEVQEQLAGMTHNLSEGINGQKVAKAFNLQSYILKRFEWAQDLFFRYQMKTAAIEENAHPLVELVGALAFAGVIVFAHYRIKSGATSTGDFFSFVTALALMMDPLRKYSQANVKVNQARAAGERIYQIMKLPEEIDSGELAILEFKDKIEFERVSFSYGEGEILKDVSFTIKKGERIGLVGLSGAGKSTILYLLLRLYNITSGEIRIDGISINRYKLSDLRKIFGFVCQELFLFHDSVRENVSVGEKFSDQEIDRAIEISGAKEFVTSLPSGVDTIIGERGTRLSGGQCQRVTIARAVLKDPDILLFDEATSALDSESEKIVQAALDRWSLIDSTIDSKIDLGNKKTVVAVAHRLTTIKNYDKIIVMRDGEITESGNHQELMEMKGEYCRLYELGLRDHNR